MVGMTYRRGREGGAGLAALSPDLETLVNQGSLTLTEARGMMPPMSHKGEHGGGMLVTAAKDRTDCGSGSGSDSDSDPRITPLFAGVSPR